MNDLTGKIFFSLALIVFIMIPSLTIDYKDITIQVDGEEIQFVTAKRTVGDVLEYKDIALQSYDYISESLDTTLTPDMIIAIVRVVKETEVVKEVVLRETMYREDSSLDRGVTSVVIEGNDGEQELIYQVTLVDGKEAERILLEKNILLQAVDREIAVGISDRITIGSISRGYRKSMTMTATAYTHTGNPTFTGVMPQRGTIAVDPNVIPLGQEVYVVGYGYAIAQDTGGAIRGNKIDVFKDTRDEAINWGRRTVKVYILD